MHDGQAVCMSEESCRLLGLSTIFEYKEIADAAENLQFSCVVNITMSQRIQSLHNLKKIFSNRTK